MEKSDSYINALSVAKQLGSIDGKLDAMVSAFEEHKQSSKEMRIELVSILREHDKRLDCAEVNIAKLATQLKIIVGALVFLTTGVVAASINSLW